MAGAWGAAPPVSAELGIRTLHKSRVEPQPSRPASSGLCPPAGCLKHRHIQLPAGSLWLNVRLGIWWYCRWGLAGHPTPGQSTSCCSPAPSSQAFVSSVGLASTERGRHARQWGACITPTASSVTPVVGNSPTPPPLPRIPSHPSQADETLCSGIEGGCSHYPYAHGS